MNKKEKLTEATMLALQEELTEAKTEDEKEKLVKDAFEGYTKYDLEQDKNYIIVKDVFDEDCITINDDLKHEFDYDLKEELNNMLANMFEKNGYDVYREGMTYAYNGKFETVDDVDMIAIKNNF